MRWNELGKFLIISLAIIGGFIMYINPLANSIKQGLDLQGGTHVVLQAVETPEAKIDDDALNRTVKIIERRVKRTRFNGAGYPASGQRPHYCGAARH